MKGILITTNDEVSIVDVETPLHVGINQILKSDIFELVHPMHLPQKTAMLVDEDGLFRKLPINQYGCFLYGTIQHGHPIVGDILLMKEGWTPDGPDLVDYPEDELQNQYDLARAYTTHIKNFDHGTGGGI